MTSSEKMSEKMTAAELKKFLDAFNNHDPDGIAEYFTDDVTFVTGREGKSVSGKEECRAYFAKMFEDMPDTRFSQDTHWVEGERGCSEWRLTGTSSNGGSVDVRGCDLFTFRDGKISRKDSFLKHG